jgi:hypothetical protein
VVVSADNKALLGHIGDEPLALIAFDVLPHAVADLQDGNGISLGKITVVGNLGLTVGGKIGANSFTVTHKRFLFLKA